MIIMMIIIMIIIIIIMKLTKGIMTIKSLNYHYFTSLGALSGNDCDAFFSSRLSFTDRGGVKGFKVHVWTNILSSLLFTYLRFFMYESFLFSAQYWPLFPAQLVKSKNYSFIQSFIHLL